MSNILFQSAENPRETKYKVDKNSKKFGELLLYLGRWLKNNNNEEFSVMPETPFGSYNKYVFVDNNLVISCSNSDEDFENSSFKEIKL